MSSWLRSTDTRTVTHLPLGRADYASVYLLQRQLHDLRVAGKIRDTVITVEHDPVFTIGRSGSAANILVPPEVLEKEGITVYEIERGGDITYHGPGQLVVYPIIDLRDQGRDLRRYVRNLEQGVIDLLAEFGIEGMRRSGFPGVWVGARKIASVGVYVKHWVTRHGLAFNVAVNRTHFGMINPCGLPIEVTSLDALTGESYPLEEIARRLLSKMEPLFDWRFVEEDPGPYWKGVE